jgi:hypothetical protein
MYCFESFFLFSLDFYGAFIIASHKHLRGIVPSRDFYLGGEGVTYPVPKWILLLIF